MMSKLAKKFCLAFHATDVDRVKVLDLWWDGYTWKQPKEEHALSWGPVNGLVTLPARSEIQAEETLEVSLGFQCLSMCFVTCVLLEWVLHDWLPATRPPLPPWKATMLNHRLPTCDRVPTTRFFHQISFLWFITCLPIFQEVCSLQLFTGVISSLKSTNVLLSNPRWFADSVLMPSYGLGTSPQLPSGNVVPAGTKFFGQ